MNPIQHGEVFVTDDGAETDLDLGHYERFIDESLTKNSNVTTGKIYWSVLQKERRGDFGGGTVQVIPHITNEIKSRFHRDFTSDETSIAIIEVGGTVGDIESQPFLESIRQFQHDVGHENAILIHVTLIPYLRASGEMKTKPTQASVKELQGMGIQPDVIVCRSELPLDNGIKDKIALFCNVPSDHVLQNLDVEYLYEAPLAMEKEHLAQVVCDCLKLDCPEPDLEDWKAMVKENPALTEEEALEYLGERTDVMLSLCDKYGYDGILIDYTGRSLVSMKPEALAEYNVRQQNFFNKVVEWQAGHTNKTLALFGNIQYFVPENMSMLNKFNYIILKTASSTNADDLSLKAYLAIQAGEDIKNELYEGVNPVPTDRFIACVQFPQAGDDDKVIGYWNTVDEKGEKTLAAPGTAQWMGQFSPDYTRKGIFIMSVQNDYYNDTYKQLREVIYIMNPNK